MSKKILLIEASETVQKLITSFLQDEDYEIRAEKNIDNLFDALFKTDPDVLLLNTDFEEPSAFDFVRMVKSLECFKYLPTGLYSAMGNTFDEEFSYDSGADCFFLLEEETVKEYVQGLASRSMSDDEEYSAEHKELLAQTQKNFKPVALLSMDADFTKQKRIENKILSDLFLLTESTSITETAEKLLTLAAQLTKSPAAALYIIENDGPHAYFVCSSKLSDEEKEEFKKVCKSDFQNFNQNTSLAMLNPQELPAQSNLDSFKENDVPLSAYMFQQLLDSNGNTLGTIHIIKNRKYSETQISTFGFCSEKMNILLEKFLKLQKMTFVEKRIRKAFSMFVPEQVIDSYVEGVKENDDEKSSTAVGEKRPVAVLFCDIRSFTNISEMNKPEIMITFLNQYFTIMCNIIKKHGGTIDKFIGDAIMALFGAPVSYEDNTRRAVAAAYEMREALAAVPVENISLPEGVKFDIGIGINYGELTVGSLGSEDRTSYTVIGDNVNLASRLEGLTKTYGTMILISESVKRDIEDHSGRDEFSFRHLDDVRVKGKDNAIPIYAVDRFAEEFTEAYKDSYQKGMSLYKQGVFNLAKEYFEKCLTEYKDNKAALLMKSRCQQFIAEPPENWDGAIKFETK